MCPIQNNPVYLFGAPLSDAMLSQLNEQEQQVVQLLVGDNLGFEEVMHELNLDSKELRDIIDSIEKRNKLTL